MNRDVAICLAAIILFVVLMAVLFGLLCKYIRGVKRTLEQQDKLYKQEISSFKQAVLTLQAELAEMGLEDIKSILKKQKGTDDVKIALLKNDIKDLNSKCSRAEAACSAFRRELISVRGDISELMKKMSDVQRSMKGGTTGGDVVQYLTVLQEVNLLKLKVTELASLGDVQNNEDLNLQIQIMICRLSDFESNVKDLEEERLDFSQNMKNLCVRVANMLDDIECRVKALEEKSNGVS